MPLVYLKWFCISVAEPFSKPLVESPSVRMPAIHARMMRASITAYSTAVVASSDLKNELILFSVVEIMISFSIDS